MTEGSAAPPLTYRNATVDDIDAVVALVESAYRGDASRVGWTTEADLLDGQRTDSAAVRAIIGAPGSRLLVGFGPDGRLLACCQLEQRDGGLLALFLSLLGAGVQAQVACNYPPWTSNTWYLEGAVVLSSDASLWEATVSGPTGGVSSATMPAGGQAVQDGTVLWYPYGQANVTNLLAGLPAVSRGYLTNYPSLANGVSYVPYGATAGSIIAGTQHFQFDGGTLFENFPGWFGRGSVTLLSTATALGKGQANATNCGLYCGWGDAGQRVSFITDAPRVAFGPLFQRQYNGQLGNIMVDDVVVSEEPWDGLDQLGGKSYVVLDFNGVRKLRRIAYYVQENCFFTGIVVDRDSTVLAAPANYTIYVEGCSLEAGGNQYPLIAGNEWPHVLGRILKCNVINGAVGGTGLTNSRGNVGYQMPASNAVSLSYTGRVQCVISNNPDLVIMSGDVNDCASAATYSAYATWLAQTNWLRRVRSGLPATPIVVLALACYGTPATPWVTAMANSMSNAVVFLKDTNTYFIDGTAWFTGSGCVTATNGTGNTDRYLSGDGVHPTDLGAKYIATRVADSLNAIFRRPQTRNFGVQSNQFGFSIAGGSNLFAVVEACTNLATPIWSPIQTISLTGGSFHFSDAQWTNYARRFYRLSWP